MQEGHVEFLPAMLPLCMVSICCGATLGPELGLVCEYFSSFHHCAPYHFFSFSILYNVTGECWRWAGDTGDRARAVHKNSAREGPQVTRPVGHRGCSGWLVRVAYAINAHGTRTRKILQVRCCFFDYLFIYLILTWFLNVSCF